MTWQDAVLIGMLLFTLVLTVTFLCHCLAVVPYVPTPWKVVNAMVNAAELRGDEMVYDLGAGDGRLLQSALQRHPGVRALGVEIAPVVWLLGKIRLRNERGRVRFRCRDFFGQKLNDADVIFLYLLPSVMKRLEPKFDAELRPGTRVISHSFQFPNKVPVRKEKVGEKKTVYVYQW